MKFLYLILFLDVTCTSLIYLIHDVIRDIMALATGKYV